MTENEALNWKTKALAYEMALSNIRADFKDIREGQAIFIIQKRAEEANDYIKLWWKGKGY